jgi:hypothetical protein
LLAAADIVSSAVLRVGAAPSAGGKRGHVPRSSQRNSKCRFLHHAVAAIMETRRSVVTSMNKRNLLFGILIVLVVGIAALAKLPNVKQVEKRGPIPPAPIAAVLTTNMEEMLSALHNAFNNWPDLVAGLNQSNAQPYKNKFHMAAIGHASISFPGTIRCFHQTSKSCSPAAQILRSSNTYKFSRPQKP